MEKKRREQTKGMEGRYQEESQRGGKIQGEREHENKL